MENVTLDELKVKWHTEAVEMYRLKGKDVYKHVREQEREYLDRLERVAEAERAERVAEKFCTE